MDTKTTYTSSEKSIYFLTDKCLAQSLAENIPARNAVPSFTLVDSISATVAAQAAAEREYADSISAAAKTQIENLATADAAGINGLSSTVDSLVEATASKAAVAAAAAEAAAKSYADELNSTLDAKTTAALAKAVEAAKLSVAKAQTTASDQSTAILTAVDAAGYAVASATTFEYDQNSHVLALELACKNGDKKKLSVDATMFIANSIVDHIVVKDGNVEVYWQNLSGSHDHVSIPVSALIQAYRAGDGIAIEKNVADGIYSVAADQTVARVADVARDIAGVQSTIAEVSTSLDGSATSKANAAKDAAIDAATKLDAAMDVRAKALEAYAASLSVASGKIAALDTADADAASKIAANAEKIAANEIAAAKAQATAETGVADAKKASEEVLAEKNRAEKQEQQLAADIASNKTATASVASRADALETRASNLEASAAAADLSIASEKARAEKAESDLKSSIAANAASVQNLDQKTTTAAAALETRASALEAKAESAANGIASLETKLAAEEARAKGVETSLANETSKLATGTAAVNADHEKRLDAAEPKIAALEAFKTELSTGGENPGGAIPAIKSDVAALSSSLATSMAYAGKIAFSKKEPDAVLGSADAKLSSFLKGLNLDKGTETVKNGSVFSVSIMGTDESYPDDPMPSDQLFKRPQDAWYLTEDSFRLADGDAWVVVAPDGAQTVALSALDSDSFRRLNSLQAADFEQAKIDAWKNFVALSGQNTVSGENSFIGKTSFKWADCYDANSPDHPNYVGGSLANTLRFLSGEIAANALCINKKIFVYDKVDSYSKVSSLSSQMQDPNVSAAVSAEYYAALSGKYCDLSVVKIGKTEYEQLAIGPTPLKDDVLYVVEADYADMYGQVCKNLSTAGTTGTSDAANVGYVDSKTQAVSAAANAELNPLRSVLQNACDSLSTWMATGPEELSSKDPIAALSALYSVLSVAFAQTTDN